MQGHTCSFYQRVQILVLGEHGRYAGAERRQLQLAAIVRGEKEKRNIGHHVAKGRGRLQPVHLWHGEIENDQIGAELLGFLDGLNSVNRLAANGEIRMRVEKQSELPTNDLVIVNKQN